MQSRSHPLADAISQRLISARAPWPGNCRCRLIIEIGRNNCRTVLVIPRVQDQAYRIPYPFCRFHRAQFIEHQHFRLKYRAQYLQLRSLHRAVIRILDLLQQFPVIVEQAPNPLAQDQFFDNTDRQMRFSRSDRSDQQQSCILACWRILLHKPARRQPWSSQRLVRPIKFEIRKFTMLITLGNSRCFQ